MTIQCFDFSCIIPVYSICIHSHVNLVSDERRSAAKHIIFRRIFTKLRRKDAGDVRTETGT